MMEKPLGQSSQEVLASSTLPETVLPNRTPESNNSSLQPILPETSTNQVQVPASEHSQQESMNNIQQELISSYDNSSHPQPAGIENQIIPNSQIYIKKNKYYDYVFGSKSDHPSIDTRDMIQRFNRQYDKSIYLDIEQPPKPEQSKQVEVNSISSIPNMIHANDQISKPQEETEPVLSQQPFASPVQHLFHHVTQQLLNEQINHEGNGNFKPSKSRQNFTEAQRTILNRYLQNHSSNPYASANDVDQLVKLTGLQPKQIRTYFTNKRMRDAKCMNLLTSRRGHSV